MKRFSAIFAMFLVLVFSTTPAEAKKFGSNRSFGKTYQTAPYTPPAAPAARSDAYQQQPSPMSQRSAPSPLNTPSKKGFLGGLLGGMLAGGLLGALLGHGGFQGLQIIDMLLLAGVAFLAFKLLRGRRQDTPAYAGHGGGSDRFGTPAPSAPQPAATAERRTFDLGNPDGKPVAGLASTASLAGGAVSESSPAAGAPGWGTASAVPFNLPPGFDMNGFLAGARDHYRTLQDAWNKNDMTKLREYLAPELYEELRADRATLEGEQHTEVMFVDAELVRADQIGDRAEVSIRFSGRYRDKSENVEEPITDIWHLERDLSKAGAPWYIVGIEA